MKKQISLIIAAIMLLGTMISFAQKPFAGTVSYSFSAKNNNNPDVAAQLASQKLDCIIMGNYSKSVVNTSGINIISISDAEQKTKNIIIDIPGMGKYYIEQDAKTIQSQIDMIKMDFNYTDETKTIAGYNCKKCNLTITNLETEEETSQVLWTTTELMTSDNINFDSYPGLKGFLMEAETTTEIGEGEKLTIVQTVSSVAASKKIKASEFDTPKDAKPISEAPAELRNALLPALGLD